MSEHRMEKRVPCYGKVIAGKTPGHLRDVNMNGCKITTMTPLEFPPETVITFLMIPDTETGIGQARFTGKIRWSKEHSGFCYYGIQVLSFDTDESIDNYRRMRLLYET